ncbi:ATP-dependent dethiobiotin synthetase BioD [Candidatus Xenohaliotis californiensis]|uniref:ATP-dependent dethiobiotin synthetase BioD n=1 Tax=Candidatus Xenohaliotis californiensis TaxID=84677 RepID=A0ABM9N8U7_9RICK|nr:ATP-dependent dethiobiotin synthetase BioD [Candidatus Xenohaliotis californiensis]
MRPIFITGTDTGVGKTTLSAWLIKISNHVYWKPIQTGKENDTKTVQNITLAQSDRFINPIYSFPKPASPHIASQDQGVTISLEKIIAAMPAEKKLIIEGAGGVMVPVNQREMIIDLIKALNSRVIIVSKTLLGTINHTLLTIKALKDYNIFIAGVVLNGTMDYAVAQSIMQYGNIEILANIPMLPHLSVQTISNIKVNKSIEKILR